MDSPSSTEIVALENAASKELETMRCVGGCHYGGTCFPPACQQLMRSLPGNMTCIDCGARNPEWANVSFGTLLCLRCAGRHRSYGVQNSFIRSITMDAWSHGQVLAMLEGGNRQLQEFFERHRMGNSEGIPDMISSRYQTKAAQFYRNHLSKHIVQLIDAGVYRGRAASRTQTPSSTRNCTAASAKPPKNQSTPARCRQLERRFSRELSAENLSSKATKAVASQ